MSPHSKLQEFKELSLDSILCSKSTASNEEGEMLLYVKQCTNSIKIAHVERLGLLKRLRDTEDPMTLHEIEHLAHLYKEDITLQQELSEALEAGRINLERRRALEYQRLEDYYYERYGFVVIEPETLGASYLPLPQRITNSDTRKWEVCIGNHDHEEMDRELQKLRQRLENLGKCPENKKQPKNQNASKSSKSSQSKAEQKCSIL